MAAAHTDNEPMRLPRAHLSRVTWVTIVAITLLIAVYIMWAVWFAEPTIMR